nr:MAG TPA: hypothetical protein [Caudoviricetes sp.]
MRYCVFVLPLCHLGQPQLSEYPRFARNRKGK